jgi:MoaA/NifB/PqqE/SkfB family radical SAM enzyme
MLLSTQSRNVRLTIKIKRIIWKFLISANISPVLIKSYTDPVRRKYFRTCIDIKKAIKRQQVILETPPLTLGVVLEGRGCNLRCIYCSHRGFEGQSEEERKQLCGGKTYGTPESLLDNIEYIAPQMGGLRFGGGEPLLYPEFYKVVNLAKNYPNMILSISTNGNLITRQLIDDVILSPGFRWLAISMDAATKETYIRIRRGGDFDKVCGIVKDIISRRKNRLFPSLQFNFVIMRSNYHEMIKLVELAKELGVSGLNYMMLIRPPGKSFKRSILKDEDLLLEIDKCAEIIEALEKIKLECRRYNILLRPDRVSPVIYNKYPELRQIDATVERFRGSRETAVGSGANAENSNLDEREDALRPEVGTFMLDERAASQANDINWKNVFCHQPFANLSAGHYRMGFCCYAKKDFLRIPFDRDDLTIMDLWNHPQIVTARELMYEGRAELVCRETCPFLPQGGLKKEVLD